MFRVDSIHISGFWGKSEVGTSLYPDVNIFIGQNGTGKTTFMNILHAVLSVDPDGLLENEFSEVKIVLTDGNKRRTVKAVKVDVTSDNPFPTIDYWISRRRFTLALPGEDMRPYSAYRRRAIEQAAQIREHLSESILLSSLSVYRFRMDPDIEPRERSKRAQSPVDARLQELQGLLTQYQFELTSQARSISIRLQKSVLMSLLYTSTNNSGDVSWAQNEDTERARLVQAYKQLGLSGTDVANRIQKHMSTVSHALKLHEAGESAPADVLAAQERLTRIVDMSLDSEQQIKRVFAQVDLFIETLSQFITNKIFAFERGELNAFGISGESNTKSTKRGAPIPFPRLSSGEKQLLILFIEALLQRKKAYVYLADEPELSLHISWQQRIISAIRTLNPTSQIIVATHSPEIAGRFGDKIIDMEDIFYA